MTNKKIILDTNLWVSFLISNQLEKIDSLVQNGQIIFIFSNELIEEFTDVVSRPKFKKYFSNKEIEEILNLFDSYGKLVKVKSTVRICRDEKDNFLLNLSIDSKADFLITGDKDLLILKKIEKTKIVTFQNFLEHIS